MNDELFSDYSLEEDEILTEGVICRLQVAGCRYRLQVAGYTSQVAIIIIIITINYCRNHGKLS